MVGEIKLEKLRINVEDLQKKFEDCLDCCQGRAQETSFWF